MALDDVAGPEVAEEVEVLAFFEDERAAAVDADS
jgi:hypothetical protein